MTGRRLACAAVTIAVLHASPLLAQSVAPGRMELTGGVQWIGPLRFNAVPANETTLAGGTRTLFDTSSRLDPSIGVAVTVGVPLRGAIRIEANLAYGTTHLTTQVSGDREGVPDVSVDTPVSQYLFGGDVLVQRAGWRRRRAAPFVVAGAAYVRQLNEGRTLVQTGTAFSAGGGIYYGRAIKAGRIRATGVRLEARALAMRGGVVLDGRVHVAPAVTASVFARF